MPQPCQAMKLFAAAPVSMCSAPAPVTPGSGHRGPTRNIACHADQATKLARFAAP